MDTTTWLPRWRAGETAGSGGAGGITEAEFAGWQDEGRQMAYEALLQYAEHGS